MFEWTNQAGQQDAGIAIEPAVATKRMRLLGVAKCGWAQHEGNARLEWGSTSEAPAECTKGALASTTARTTRAKIDLLIESFNRGF